MDLISELPSGPLDNYRKNASFCWKKMKLFLYTNEKIQFLNEAYHFIENDPAFQHYDDLSLEDQRYYTYLRMKKLYRSKIFYPDDYYLNLPKAHAINSVVGLYDWSLLARKGLLKDFAISGIYGLGTERHMPFISKLMNLEVGFAFCLTEISHGTNTKAMRTEARYDKASKSFVIHTPDFEAAKCWAGCLGKTASHCLVFAQLFTPDGKCHGLHCFIVPVRDPQTLLPYPGVTIIDMGSKVGLNGVDNGIVIFNHYAIPKENLLNKTGDVTDDGVYVSPYKDPNKRFGASLGNLSTGRISIIGFGVQNLRKCLTIAIRYSGVRRQFGENDKSEIPVLEYPLQQYRLFPYLSGLYALHFFSEKMKKYHYEFNLLMMEGQKPDLLAVFGQEIHGLSSVGKPYSGWLARDAIQECREACGGHGYLKAAGFGYIRDDNDANCTYEGDNNVLLQQTSNWLLNIWSRRHEGASKYPMGTVDFLGTAVDRILNMQWSAKTFQLGLSEKVLIDRCLEAYLWLICWLCEVTSKEEDRLTKEMGSKFHAKNNNQIYRAHSLALAYGEKVIISWFSEAIEGAEAELKPPLKRLCALFALTRMLNHLSSFVEGGMMTNRETLLSDVHDHIKRLLRELLPDAVSLVDAVAPPDFFLRSALGKADGKVYDHLYQAMTTSKGALTRDEHWPEMSYPVLSKL